MFFDFMASFVFDKMFFIFEGVLGVHLVCVLKKCSGNGFTKGTYQNEDATLVTCAHFSNKNNSSSTTCCSNVFPLCISPRGCSKMLFGFVSIANVSLEGNEKGQGQEHIAYDLSRPWPRPGEFKYLMQCVSTAVIARNRNP